MCGIAGCYQQADGHKLTDVMTERIAHRGPDAGAIWSHEDERASIHLGHRRLSIIDLSTSANQPLVKGDLTLVYNGELYNYRELRAELEKKGASFITSSDTEVVLEAWRHWGPEALERFRGMFAFAIADTATGELALARDPLGIKPLLYLRRGDGHRVRLRAQGAGLRRRPGAADRARRDGRVHALLLGARAAVLDPGRAQAPGGQLGALPARRHARGALRTGGCRTSRGKRPKARPPTSKPSSRRASPRT